jgi:hypothetical protein
MNVARTTAQPAAIAAPTATTSRPENVSLDETLSSTTPDVPARSPLLDPAATLGWGTALGIGVGMAALRSRGAGWGPAALGAGGMRGALVGAGIGAALLALDRLTGGQVKQQLDHVSLERRAQVLFVLRNPTRPWLASTGLRVARDARAEQERLYGSDRTPDGGQDAFRHAYATGLFTLRMIRDRGEQPDLARRLAIAAGAAHEVDGQDNNDELSRAMDLANNDTGGMLAGDGRPRAGEPADEHGFLTEPALRERVLAAMADGKLQVVDRSTTPAAPRPSGSQDLPVAG